MKKLLLTLTLTYAFLAISVNPLFAFVGSLSSDTGGISGTGSWLNSTDPVILSWEVEQNPDSSWSYMYELTVPEPGEISHLIIETSDSFTDADLIDPVALIGSFDETEIDTYDGQGNSNPGILDDIYGIKFDDASGLTLTIEFDSPRAPVWGDFYTKDGKAGQLGFNAAWNTGFTANDLDPLLPPQNGSINFHLLVPDTFISNGVIPAPGAVLLSGIGLCVVGWIKKRRPIFN